MVFIYWQSFRRIDYDEENSVTKALSWTMGLVASNIANILVVRARYSLVGVRAPDAHPTDFPKWDAPDLI
jgi:hypothetical protein